MNFSEMKDQGINGVNWYFNRNWNRDDVMNMDEISDEVHSTLKMVHTFILTLSIFLSFYLIANSRIKMLQFMKLLFDISLL
ncbi:hypothetical protein RDI58_018256 [Solanum bulbocastanum]|uniref:Uncharacterized protein n=1 Tax=Solanum bulbocastanum TaxID=147425 RepID=A0AAN8TG68_SOLBU